MGISDKIEAFINELMKDDDDWVELKRNELASIFRCVPSQINYVISTRFSPERGYVVESRRGGGGYLRIRRAETDSPVRTVICGIGDAIDYPKSRSCVKNLLESHVIDEGTAAPVSYTHLTGDEILGDCRPSQDPDKYAPLIFVKKINGDTIDVALKRRPFEHLTPIYPTEKLALDSGVYGGAAAKLIDIIAPIGKGQRGMIVAPPKAGKTTLIKTIANAITKNHPEVKLIVLLIDERPEEVTDIKESIDGDVVFSTFDQMPENHCKISEMVLERAMRLVEQKKDVVILLDSITRLDVYKRQGTGSCAV